MGCGSSSNAAERKETINIHSVIAVPNLVLENLEKEKDRFIMIRIVEVEAENKYEELKVVRVLELSATKKSLHKKFIYECLLDTFRNFQFYLPNQFAFIEKNDKLVIGKMKITPLMNNEPLELASKKEYLIPVFQQKFVKKASLSYIFTEDSVEAYLLKSKDNESIILGKYKPSNDGERVFCEEFQVDD